MPITYTIYSRPTKKKALALAIDQRTPKVLVPPHIGLGVGNKREKYRAWLNEPLKREDGTLQFFVQIHTLAKDKEGLKLEVNPNIMRLFPWLGDEIKYFIENNCDLLDTLAKYYKDGNKIDPSEAPQETDKGMSSSNMTIGDLPPEDRDQILELMRQVEAGELQVPTVDMTPATEVRATDTPTTADAPSPASE